MSPHLGQIAPHHRTEMSLMFGSWRDRAACSGQDTSEWFQAEELRKSGVLRRAKDICASCPVRKECLSAAMEVEDGNHTRFGVWGGLTGRQRYELAMHPERAADFEPKICLACTRPWFPGHKSAVACSNNCRLDLERITRPDVA